MVILASFVTLLAVGIFLRRQVRRPVPAQLPQTALEILDLNHAPAAALESLPGIGQILADRIVDDREAHGPFSSVEDVTRVPGIGKGKLEQMAPYITVTP